MSVRLLAQRAMQTYRWWGVGVGHGCGCGCGRGRGRGLVCDCVVRGEERRREEKRREEKRREVQFSSVQFGEMVLECVKQKLGCVLRRRPQAIQHSAKR